MNYAGNDLLSRPTTATGRALLSLGAAVIGTVLFGIDVTGLSLLGVEFTEEQIASITMGTLGILFISHLVNWSGDLISLGRWNSAMRRKRVGGNFDAGELRPELDVILSNLQSYSRHEGFPDRNVEVANITTELKKLESSMWWHQRASVFYVLVWGFLIPVGFGACAVWLLWDG